MTKTLAAIAVIIIAAGMAWGLKKAADRNQAAMGEFNTPEIREQTLPSAEGPKEEVNKIKLEILLPQSGETVNKSRITLSGNTVPFAEVTVDDKELKADNEGKFEVKLNLDEGENEIMVTANDENGDFAEKSVKVSYEPEE